MVGVSWSEEEENYLKYLFVKIPLNCKKYSKFKKIHEQFIANGYNKSQKAIERKSYRLGLRNYTVEVGYFPSKCSVCKTDIMVHNRYRKRKNFYCEKCEEERRRSWSSTEKGKAYHKKYLKNWRKSQKDKE